jgi:NifB/MoaA-like Fe-S oxidoreductase
MKIRDRNVMAVVEMQGNVAIEILTGALSDAVKEAQVEGVDAETDVAVVLLAGFVGFRFHADTIPYDKFNELLEQCTERLNEVPLLQ